uniref:ZP domain-containing protein n=1 Tax=Heterorhabditis bacteriophora TaxID=37862 RepID=A0A1I7XNA1_HETBA
MAPLSTYLFFIVAGLLLTIESYDMNNEIIGPPSVQCTQDIIKFSIKTRSPFRGNIYIKGNYGNDHCRQEFSTNDFPEATFAVRIGECGMMRLRKLQPRGMAYHTVFVANFHSMFTTKLDKEYAVECFYELGHLSVQTDMEVSPIPMEIIKKATVVMPDCVYSVREGTVNGPRARNSIIGTQVVHRWDCNNDSKYGILIKNCHVHERSGLSIQIIDERGCPLRLPYLVSPIIYDVSSNMAYMMSEAVSIPDRNHIFFQCQIQICNRMENECLGLTVVATFEGRIHSTIGNTFVEGTVGPLGTFDNKIPFTHPNYPREYGKFPWRKEQNQVDEEESIDEVHAENMNDANEDRNETGTRTDAQYNINVGENRTSDLREKRLADQVIDVYTDELTIRSTGDLELEAVHSPTTFTQDLTCLNRTAIVTMGGAFAFTTVLSMLFIIFLSKNLCKGSNRKAKSMEQFADHSMTSDYTSDGNIDRPIYTRRLGDSTYALPLRRCTFNC